MRTAAAHGVVIQAVGARQLATCAAQRAVQQRCVANSRPVEMPPQRAPVAENTRNARS